ncbi:MAG: hypothetical protein K2P63_00735 [Lachnospiraceae bacterium]|nr:hypothetical protein [Lachnospiraceae bacterium]
MLNTMMPITLVIGFFILAAVYLITKCVKERTQINSIDQTKFNTFVEEIKRENAQIRKDLQTVKTKVEAIDGMMKEI